MNDFFFWKYIVYRTQILHNIKMPCLGSCLETSVSHRKKCSLLQNEIAPAVNIVINCTATSVLWTNRLTKWGSQTRGSNRSCRNVKQCFRIFSMTDIRGDSKSQKEIHSYISYVIRLFGWWRKAWHYLPSHYPLWKRIWIFTSSVMIKQISFICSSKISILTREWYPSSCLILSVKLFLLKCWTLPVWENTDTLVVPYKEVKNSNWKSNYEKLVT